MLLPYRFELLRKALHLSALVIPLGMLLLERNQTLLVLGTAAAACTGMDIIRARLPAVNAWVVKVFGLLMRSREKAVTGSRVVFTGSSWMLISAFILALAFPKHLAACALALFIVGDGAAALVGRRYGRLFWRKGDKTVEGSLAFLGSALLVVFIFPGVSFTAAALACLGACLVEAMPGPFNDNFAVPLSAALIMSTLEYFL